MAIAFINNKDQVDKNNNCNDQSYRVGFDIKADQASTPPGFPQTGIVPENLDFDVNKLFQNLYSTL
jgi:hypothetical protein